MAYFETLYIDQGSDFRQTFYVYSATGMAKDLSSFTGACYLRRYPGASGPYTDINVAFGSVTGQVSISLSGISSNSLTAGTYSFDILAYNNPIRERILEGTVYVSPSVTRN